MGIAGITAGTITIAGTIIIAGIAITAGITAIAEAFYSVTEKEPIPQLRSRLTI
jgi:hypothetical protein